MRALLLAALALVIPACGGARSGDDTTPDTSATDPNLDGTWTTTVEASALPAGATEQERDALLGEWTVHFGSEGAFQLRRAGTTRADGRWHTEGSTLVVEQAGASGACREPGRYAYDAEFDHLILTVQLDDCTTRRVVLATPRLTRQ